ncbi:hypothetical protein [Streptomyces sp. NPDC086010]|uniref:hypothetical protein n=1 Tax=Streptomyces sp. NPDC086010 TaxID=3365745 RepID=UPI0037D81C2B
MKAQSTRVNVQDGVRILAANQFAQLIEPPVACQQFGIGDEGVLSEESASGDVLAEDPDCLISTARPLQHTGLQLLSVGKGVVPVFFAAGLTCTVCKRGNQLQHPLVTALPIGNVHQNGQEPRLVEVRDE